MSPIKSEREILLAAILANPADDAPRLSYADWLEENAEESVCGVCQGLGNHGFDSSQLRDETIYCSYCNGTGRVSNGFAERAEFIRVQCEIAKLPTECERTFCDGQLVVCPDCRMWKKLHKREGELFPKSHDRFDGGLEKIQYCTPSSTDCLTQHTPQIFIHAINRRGFLDEIRCTIAQYLDHCHAIAAQHPVTRWVLTDRKPQQTHWFANENKDKVDGYADSNWLPWSIAKLLAANVHRVYPMINFTRHEWHHGDSLNANDDLQQACYHYARISPVTQPLPQS